MRSLVVVLRIVVHSLVPEGWGDIVAGDDIGPRPRGVFCTGLTSSVPILLVTWVPQEIPGYLCRPLHSRLKTLTYLPANKTECRHAMSLGGVPGQGC